MVGSNCLEVYHIETLGSLDGPGVRTVIFLQGCPLRCNYCHNPDSWLYKQGKGTWMSFDDLLKIIMKNKAYYGQNGGVTFSGGEPLLQAENLIELIKLLKKLKIHSAIDTSGSVYNMFTEDVLKQTDLVLLDIKAFDDASYKALTTKGMILPLKTLEFIRQENIKHWLRHVRLPGAVFNLETLESYASHDQCEKYELLDYHDMGKDKWETWQLNYRKEYALNQH